MHFMLVIGAYVLNPFLGATHIPEALGTALTGAGLGPYGTLALIILGYVVLGMFLDSLSMLVVTIPIVFPIIQTLGFDPIWFGVVAVIVVEMGLTQPLVAACFTATRFDRYLPSGPITWIRANLICARLGVQMRRSIPRA